MNAEAIDLNPALQERELISVAIDSREVQAGDLFFALSQPDYKNNGFTGDFEDASKYIPAAFEKGAAACVVRGDRFREHLDEIGKFKDKLIITKDCIASLQSLARGVFEEWNGPVVAITGSAGKTTAKELTAHVLASSGKKVLKNIKNYNNGLGHPLTVMNLARDKSYDVAVLEMGMSTPMNEIARLCRITPPDIAVELNVLPVHVEHLGSIENVAKAKAELVEGMKETGTAVLNADDPRVMKMRELAKGKTLTFGLSATADVRAENIRFERFGRTNFTLCTPNGSADVGFSLNGNHNVLNALAASAVGHLFGITADAIAKALGTAKPPEQRGEVLHFREGFTVINDSYNSNPAALLSMAKMLAEGSANATRRIIVAGEMLELGENEATMHRDTGREIAEFAPDLLIGVRGLANELVLGAREAGVTHAEFAPDSDAAGEMLVREIKAGDAVLVKGSRGVRTEKVIAKLLEKFELEK